MNTQNILMSIKDNCNFNFRILTWLRVTTLFCFDFFKFVAGKMLNMWFLRVNLTVGLYSTL